MAGPLESAEVVRGQVAGWNSSRRGDEDAPSLEGFPRFVQGPKETRHVEGLDYEQVWIGSTMVDPQSVRPIEDHDFTDEELHWSDPELLWPDDNPRLKRYRALQSKYRQEVLLTKPGRRGEKRLGSMLLPAAAGEGLNFLHTEIHEYARQRAQEVHREGGSIEPGRLYGNMLSSMPLCFNLFGHLRKHMGVAAENLSRALELELGELTKIEVEFAPQPPGDYLGDRTAFDAFVEYQAGTMRGFLAIETKYTEPFTRKVYETNVKYGEVTTSGYGFRPGAAERLKGPATNQLWRNSMLALKLQELGKYDRANVVVLACEGDAGAASAVAGLRADLVEPGFVRSLTYERLIEDFLEFAQTEYWAKEFNRRYLDLSQIASRE